MRTKDALWLAGVDGCPVGWIAAFVRPDGDESRVRIVPRFADVVAAPEAPAVIAVDMPIGLPDRTGLGGRAAENTVRTLLGARQSSVFSVPSRAAVYADDYAQRVQARLGDIRPAAQGVEAALQYRTAHPRNRRIAARRFPPQPSTCSRCILKSASGG